MSQRNRRSDKNDGNGFGRLRTNSTPRSRFIHDASHTVSQSSLRTSRSTTVSLVNETGKNFKESRQKNCAGAIEEHLGRRLGEKVRRLSTPVTAVVTF
jgi:hypothetical protein